MEQIIILIAIGLLSTLFNKKNKGEAQKQKQEASRTNEVPQNQPIPQRQPMPQGRRLHKLDRHPRQNRWIHLKD